MMNFTGKDTLLVAAAIAFCTLALPSMTSAATWGVIGSHHTLDSPDIGIASTTGLTDTCTNSSFTARVANAATLTITTATFTGCTTRFNAIGADCTTTWRGTGFPWRATAVTETAIQIHGIHVHLHFENMPGRPGSCGVLADSIGTITGTLSSGHWTGNGVNQHEVTWAFGTGLTNQAGLPVTLTGTLRDTQQTLVVTG